MVLSALFSFLFQGLSGSSLAFVALVTLIVVLWSRLSGSGSGGSTTTTTSINTKKEEEQQQQKPRQEEQPHQQVETQSEFEQPRQLQLSLPQEMIEALTLCIREDSELDSLSATSSFTSSTSSSPASLSPSTSLSQIDTEFLDKQNKEVEEDVEWTLNAIEQKVERKAIHYEVDIDSKIDELYTSLKLKTDKKKKKGLFNWLAKDSYDRSPQMLFTSAQHSIRAFFKGKVMVKNIVNEELARQFVRQWALYKLRYGPSSEEAKPKMAFHGTREESQNIIQDGIKLPGSPGFQQVCNIYGPGIYLSTKPGISDHFTEGKKLVVCAVLPGKSGVYNANRTFDSYRNQEGDVLVMPSASQVLPIYLVRYGDVKSKLAKPPCQ